ncbi:MAG: TetR/AcrR family transcriptional regulator [Lachnospiraceae bacterium]|nr:TetR/AcrR family transcriptional regulator [Lachnospiraceae bacterium]
MGKEDLRVIKTLDSIDKSLLENLKKMPFNKITVEALCSKARINRTTFYKHYSDKYELLDNYLSRVLEEFRSVNNVIFVDAEPETINEDLYKMPFRETVDFIISKKDIYEILWTAQIDRNIFDEMIEVIAENILKRKIEQHPEIKTDSEKFFKASLFANLFAYNNLVSVRWWLANDYVISKNDFYQLFDDMMREGMFKVFKEQL